MRIVLGNTKTKLIEGFATVVAIEKKTVAEMKKHNDNHFANDFIEKNWIDRPWLHALVLSDVELNPRETDLPNHTGQL